MSLTRASTSFSYTEYGIPIRNIWHMLLYAWNEPLALTRIDMGDIEQTPSLDGLYAIALVNLLQQRMRLGLGRGYKPVSGCLRTVRGRVDITESVRHQTFVHGEAVCNFQQYDVDDERHRVIRSVLARLAQIGDFGPNNTDAGILLHRVRSMVRALDGVELVEPNLEMIRRLMLRQNDNDYRLMLSVCELILMRQMPLNVAGPHLIPQLNPDALTLHRIYERFVANFFKKHLKGWDVQSQKRLDWHTQDDTGYLPSMVPDLLLQEQITGRMIILDTKFTAASLLENRWGRQVYDSSHLYQLYAYLRSQEQLSVAHGSAVGVLLYPTVRERLSERVRLQGHLVCIESIDLTAPWKVIENQLLQIVQINTDLL